MSKYKHTTKRNYLIETINLVNCSCISKLSINSCAIWNGFIVVAFIFVRRQRGVASCFCDFRRNDLIAYFLTYWRKKSWITKWARQKTLQVNIIFLSFQTILSSFISIVECEEPYPSLSDYHDYEPNLEFDDTELLQAPDALNNTGSFI